MFLWFINLLLHHSLAWGAACCGGGLAAPALILGDERAQITTAVSQAQIVDDVSAKGIWRSRDYAEQIQVYRVDYAHIVYDRWQSGVSLPVVSRAREGQSSSGLGDVSLNLGYEYLPDWDYNYFRPKGLGYLQLVLPSGESIQQTDSIYQLEARGRGFWALGAGTILTKVFGRTDVFTSFDLHRSFDKSYSNALSNGSLHPGWGGSLGLGAGYNLEQVRFGTSLTWTYEDPVDVRGTEDSNGSAQRYATASLSLSYLLNEDWTATASYSDQTLFGSPSTTTLAQIVQVQLQKRWPR